MTSSSSLAVALSSVLLLATAACGGAAESDAAATAQPSGSTAEPPPVATRFELRVDGKKVDLGEPDGMHFHGRSGDTTYSYVTLGAQRDPRGSDFIQAASVGLSEPFHTGSIDCTPNARGETTTGASLAPGPFLGFTPTLKNCVVEVTWITEERAVGRFSADAYPPEESSLAGKVAKVDGEFDVPLRRIDL